MSGQTQALISTDHLVPMPTLAGWTEERRLAEMASIRAQIAATGGTITTERRTRNTAFDEPGEKTTWAFTVQWVR